MKITRIIPRVFAYLCVSAAAIVTLISVSSAQMDAVSGSYPSAPAISLFPTEFAMTEAGRTSGPMSAVVTNTSWFPITISATTLIDTTNFSLPASENGCLGRKLWYKNDYCTMNVYFQPQTAGHISTSLSVTYANFRKTAKTVSGNAYVPHISPSTSSVDFGQKTINSGRETRTVTLTNNALIAIDITSIEVVSLDVPPTPFDAEQACVTSIAAGASCDLVIGFNPTEARSYSGAVVIRDGFDQDVQLDLDGTGILPGQPDITLSTTALEFGRVQVGATSSAMPVTLVSTGTVALSITAIDSLLGSDFVVTNAADCIKVLVPTEHCTIQAVFTPSAGGERAGQIRITDDAPDSPQTVSLSGVGVDPGQPSVDLSATELDFGSQTVGTSSETLYILVANVGGAALTISDVAITGAFSQLNDCVGTVPAGGRCGIAVTFAPTATGELAGAVTITDNAAGSPHTVALEGTGTETGTPQASLSASGLVFADQQEDTSSAAQTITLTNTGNADLSVGLTSIDGEGAASFGRSDTCRESIVEPGKSCSIDVVFTPQTTGAIAALLSIDDDASGTPHTATLSGTGTATPSSGGGCSLIPGRSAR